MSHIVTIDIEMRDLPAVRAAAARCGLEFVEGQTRVKAWGGATITCAHALRVAEPKQATWVYDVAVVRLPNGAYTLQGDLMHAQIRDAVGGASFGKFKQAYATELSRRMLMRDGFHVTEVQATDGRIRLLARR